MDNEVKIIGPSDNGEVLQPDSEIVVPGTDYTEQNQTVFVVGQSQEHQDMLEIEEQADGERFPKARAYFKKGKKLTYEMIPDHIKGEEGKRFLKIAAGLATVAAAGTGAYLVIKKKSRG